MTILFLQDWKRYKNAIADTKTKNRSFVALADKYRQLGIKNYFFHLALMQPELQGVDPYDPNLSPEIMAKIIVECKYNPWYFFREVFRLPSSGSDVPDPLRANRGNIGIYWCYFNHIDSALIQPRQTGKSVGADGINTYVTQVAGRNATFSLITKDHDLRTKNVQRLKDMRDALPPYLNPFQKNLDTNNQYGISVIAHQNKFATGVAQNSEAAALNLGRGSTSESNQIDEGPFCKYIQVTIPAFLSSANAARENARKNNSFYGNIFTTTAGKLDTPEGKYMYDMFTGGMLFDERALYDAKDEDEAHLIVQKNSPGDKPMVYICLSHRQLGYTDEWLYKKMADSNSKGAEADRDYMNRWTTGSLRSPLDQRVLDVIRASVQDTSNYMEMTESYYTIQWYIDKQDIAERLSNGHFVLGNDTSEAVGKDSITMCLQDAETLEVIFTVSISETNVYRFIDWFADLMVQYPNIVTIPERKSVGVTLIDGLLLKLVALNINPFKRIYNIIVDDGLHLSDEEFRFVHREPQTWPANMLDKYKNKFGFGTSGGGKHSRDGLYKTLTRAAELAGHVLKDNGLCTEISQLVIKNDRIDHPSKGHDDMVIAWLLGVWMLLHSKNLDFYGIMNPAGRARSIADREKAAKVATGWDHVRDSEQTDIQNRIKENLAKLEVENDYMNAERIEVLVMQLSRRLTTDSVGSSTVANLINNAREARDARLQERKYSSDGGAYNRPVSGFGAQYSIY